MTSALHCPHCGASISAADKFCAHCGTKLISQTPESESPKTHQGTIVCASCGRVNPMSEKICFGCGSPLDAAPAVTETKKESSVSKTQAKKKKKIPQTNYVIGIFIALAIVIIAVEYFRSPSGDTHVHTPATQQSQPTDPSVVTEITNLEAKIKSDPKDSDALLRLANMLHDAKFYPRAIETYKQFLALKPNDADARVDMAICYFETDDAPRAVREIESVVKQYPKHQMAVFNLGVIHLSSGNMDEAKKWLKKAVEIDSLSPAGQRARDLLHQH
ncbi:MAG: tetratricopeptide repeat protein [Bacteroidota bacterium]